MKNKRKWLKHKKKILPLILVALALVVVFYYYILPSFFTIPDLSTHGFSPVTVDLDVGEDEGTLIFDSECYEISMTITKDQAVSIQNGINGVIDYRPNTHDLMNDMLKNLGAKILMVKITEMQDSVYIAKILIKKGNLILSLDSRPSDAIAIAARTEYFIDIYVNDTLLETMGEKIC